MLLRSLVVGVSLVALLGSGEGWCGDLDDASRGIKRARVIPQAGDPTTTPSAKKARGDDQIPPTEYTNAPLTQLPAEIWLDGVLPHMGWGEVEALTQAVPTLHGVFRDLVGLPEVGLPPFEAALNTLSRHWSAESQAFQAFPIALYLRQWFAPGEDREVGFVSVAYWARLLREGVALNTDGDGTLSLVPELKTQLNKALEEGDKTAVARSLMILRHQRDFFTENMDWYVRSLIITALAKLTVVKIAAFASAWSTHQSKFVTENMRGYCRYRIIYALAPLTVEKIAVLSEHASHYFTQEMNGFDREIIINAFVSKTTDEIATFSTAWTTHQDNFVSENIRGGGRALIINALAELPPEKIAAFADAWTTHQNTFVTADMDGLDRSRIIATLTQKTADEIEAFAKAWTTHQSKFVTADMFDGDHAKIILALAEMTPKQIATFASAWTKHQGNFVSDYMVGYARARIIAALAKLTPDQFADLVERHSRPSF